MGKKKRVQAGATDENEQTKTKKSGTTRRQKKAEKEKDDIKEDTNSTKKVTTKEKVKKEVNEAISDDSSSSSSSSESDKKESNSGSESDSDTSESEVPVAPKTINSVTNLSPVKRYVPPPSDKSSSTDSYHSDTEEEDKKRRKKQKKQIQMQLNKKMKHSPNRKNDNDTDNKNDEDENDVVQSHNDEVLDWPESDYVELIKRMELQLPLKDNQKFDSRAAKLDWSQIAFQSYTARDCCDTWNKISKRIRRFRILSEMLNDAKDWVNKPWTNFYRGSKRNRHPDMPSRPLSTYMIYYLEHKDRVAKDNPGMEMTQVSKIISEMYKNLDSSEREKYADKAAKERQNFGERLTEFYKEHPDMALPQKFSGRDVVLKGPRKPSTPFKLFVQEQLKMYASDPVNSDRKSVEEKAKEKWKNLSDKKKLIWIDWALEDAKRYDDEIKVYKMEHPDYVAPIIGKSVLNKDERVIKERLAGKPLKPPNSAYSLFSRIMLQSDKDVKSIPPKLRMAEISRKWKMISDDEKHRYEETVRELQDQYKLEFASYLETLPQDERDEQLQKNQPKRKQAAAAAAAAAATAKPEEKMLRKRANKTSSAAAAAAAVAAGVHNSAATPTGAAATGGGGSVNNKKSETVGLNLYKGEPSPPPVRAYDLFLNSFLSERPAGTSEATRLLEAPKYWEILPESNKESYRKKLEEMKQKYISSYELFLKRLSPEELKEFSVMKAKAKKIEEAQEEMCRVNGRQTDSNDSDTNESSSGSDSDDTGSGKSSKSSTTSDESDN